MQNSGYGTGIDDPLKSQRALSCDSTLLSQSSKFSQTAVPPGVKNLFL